MIRHSLPCAALALAIGAVQPAQAVPVDLELLFLNDVSGSIDGTDFGLQVQGFADAFRSNALIEKIADGAIGSIAVSLGFFATNIAQSIPFTQISDAADGEAFATAVEALLRPSLGSADGQVNALTVGPSYFEDNGFEGTRNVIDVVTEGTHSFDGCGGQLVCAAVQDARDDALTTGGVTAINALVLDDRDFFGNDPEDSIDAVTYAQTNLIGGIGSFATFVEDFTGFGPAIESKIIREIAPPVEIPPVPLPAGLPLLLGALGALGLAKRRSST